jgi:outer membrane PBP1 activator LpoA protein
MGVATIYKVPFCARFDTSPPVFDDSDFMFAAHRYSMQRLISIFFISTAFLLSACQPIQSFLPKGSSGQNVTVETKNIEEESFLAQAESAFQQGNNSSAENLLLSINERKLNGEQSARFQLLRAILLFDGNNAPSLLQELQRIESNKLPRAAQSRFYALSGQLNEQQGNTLSAAIAYSQLEQLSEQAEQKDFLISAIARLLSNTPSWALQNLQPSDEKTKAWMQYELIQRIDNQTDREAQLALWLNTHPNHPANTQRSTKKRLIAKRYQHIAVFLPMSGDLAYAGNTLREGITAQWHLTNPSDRPKLSFYDTNNADITSLLLTAINEGAEFAIGPLEKQAVSQLAQTETLPLPVLALNHVPLNAKNRSLYRFALLPESEAEQAADFLWMQNHHAPLLFTPNNAWGERMAQAFKARWQKITGTLPAHQTYNDEAVDFSADIKMPLHLTASEQRYESLRKLLGEKINYEPRRRDDVDAIYLAAQPRQAQSFAPQLEFHRAGDLPLYASSSIWNGFLDKQQLADLNGITVSDAPLLLARKDHDAANQMFPDTLSDLRLYAMGRDALKLAFYTDALSQDSKQTLDGQTGSLSIDDQGVIQRQTVWVKLGKRLKALGYAPITR